MKIKNVFSPNFDKKKRSYNLIKFIVIHYTGMQSERESMTRLTNPKSKVSSHFLINRRGDVFRLVEDNRIAWHAGRSCWGKYKNLNKNSIGIELVNKGHKFGYQTYSQKQLLSLIKICKKIMKKYKIHRKNILGHSDIAPQRKIDPGEKFSWERLAKNKVGLWHNYQSNFLKKLRKKKISKKEKLQFIKKITRIGYCVPSKRKHFFVKFVKAFQRRYRKELINGMIDAECLVIAKKL